MKYGIETLTRLATYAMELKSSGIADMFVDYSPHVETIDVRIFIPRWNNTTPIPDYSVRISRDCENFDLCLYSGAKSPCPDIEELVMNLLGKKSRSGKLKEKTNG
jgi:hypothetical protein